LARNGVSQVNIYQIVAFFRGKQGAIKLII